VVSAKPADYRARRTWQLDARARGEVPECGREACHNLADPAWVGSGTGVELLYCARCAREINRYTPGRCVPETVAASGNTVRTVRDSTAAATADIPDDPMLNCAQRRARGDYRPRNP
jgi:hypothetical protein